MCYRQIWRKFGFKGKLLSVNNTAALYQRLNWEIFRFIIFVWAAWFPCYNKEKFSLLDSCNWWYFIMRELPYGFKTYKRHWRPDHSALKPLESHASTCDQTDLDVLDSWLNVWKEGRSNWDQLSNALNNVEMFVRAKLSLGESTAVPSDEDPKLWSRTRQIYVLCSRTSCDTPNRFEFGNLWIT
jgi:hypothetical protein